MKKFIYIFILLFALVGLAFSFFSMNLRNTARPPMEEGHLAKMIPATIGKFTSKDIPLGETEEVSRSAEKSLAVNEFFNRSYSDSRGIEFTVYISYWAQGKESTARASAHTPDRCWVGVGWKHIEGTRQSAEVLTANGKELMPAYYREMVYDTSLGETKRNIYFWFIREGERYDYGTEDNRMPSLSKYVDNMITDSFIISPECYFIRIDSSNDLRTLVGDEDFQRLLDYLGNLILYPKEK